MIVSSRKLVDLAPFYFKGFLFGKTKKEADEFVQQSIDKDGISALQTLNGNFCGYYICQNKKELYLFNDRLGMVDLYVLRQDNGWVLTSDYWQAVDALTSFTINDKGIEQLLHFNYMHWSNTYISEINLCQPATIVTIDLNTAQIKKEDVYWKHQPEVTITNKESAKEQLIESLKKGVNESFNEPDRNYIIANSGGLDSRWNMHYAHALKKQFVPYTYAGKLNSDAIHISKKVNESLKQDKAKYLQVSTSDFIPKYVNEHINYDPMLSSYGTWYFDAYHHLSQQDVNVNGFASTFLDSFTYMDEKGSYKDVWKASKSEQYAYCFDLYKASDKTLIDSIFKKGNFADLKESFTSQLESLNMDDLGDVCDTYDFNCRQRRLNKNEPWTNFYGKMDSRNPLLHNDIVDLSLQLPFDMRHNRSLYKEAALDVMGELNKIRFERSPWGLKRNNGRYSDKIKELAWRVDTKMYKELGWSVWFKGNHKNVAEWMCQEPNYTFIRDVFSTKLDLISDRFNQNYLLTHLNVLIKADFVFVSSLLSVFLFLIRLSEEKKMQCK